MQYPENKETTDNFKSFNSYGLYTTSNIKTNYVKYHWYTPYDSECKLEIETFNKNPLSNLVIIIVVCSVVGSLLIVAIPIIICVCLWRKGHFRNIKSMISTGPLLSLNQNPNMNNYQPNAPVSPNIYQPS